MNIKFQPVQSTDNRLEFFVIVDKVHKADMFLYFNIFCLFLNLYSNTYLLKFFIHCCIECYLKSLWNYLKL